MKMRYTLAFLILILFSCNNEDLAPAAERKIYQCDPADFVNTDATVCCIGGAVEVIPGETLIYTFMTTASEPVLEWEVRGEITILEGQGTGEVKLQIGENFTSGAILMHCKGDLEDGSYLRWCTDMFEVKVWEQAD